MLPLKLVRSLILGESIIPNHSHSETATSSSSSSKSKSKPKSSKTKTPFLLFTPTRQLITDTYILATLSRDIGLDLYPNPSLSHIIFSWPSSSTLPSLSTSSCTSSSSNWSLPNDAVALPFPSLRNASLSHLRFFCSLSNGFFKLVFLRSGLDPVDGVCGRISSNWDCFSGFLISHRSGSKIDSMEEFSRALTGAGWTMYETGKGCRGNDSGKGRNYGSNSVYLFRKVDLNRVRTKVVYGDGSCGPSGECRVRELRLPRLDFANAPLRILQYILLMTDDIFYLA